MSDFSNTRGSKTETVAGYEILNELGSDRYGVYHRARHMETGAFVLYRGFECPEGMAPSRWQRAMQRMVKVHQDQAGIPEHPSIQKVLNFGIDGELFYVFFEYIEGRTLRQILRSDGAKPLDWVIDVFTQVASALDHAAKSGFCHTDLSYYNIFIRSSDQTAHILNWGLGKLSGKRKSATTAPEQVQGSRGDWRTDIYSMGILLYQCLQGRRPFSGKTSEELQKAILYKDAPPLGTQTKPVQDVVAKLLRKNPKQRYHTCIEAINDLRNGTSPVDVGQKPQAQILLSGMYSIEAIKNTLSATFKRPGPEVEIQQYLDQLHIQGKERKEGERVRTVWKSGAGSVAAWAFRLTVLGVLVMLCIHAATLPGAYRYATILKVTGTTEIVRNGKSTPLQAGDVLDGREGGALKTGADSSIILDMNGTRLKLGANTLLSISKLGFSKGAIRQFSLTRGQVWAKVMPLRGKNARFLIVCNGVKVSVKGTDFTVASTENGAEVDTLEGSVKVDSGSSTQLVEKGEQIVATSNAQLYDPLKLTEDQMKKLLQGDIEEAGGFLTRLSNTYTQIQESTLVPLVNGALAMTPLNTEGTGKWFFEEVKDVTSARIAMEAISKSLMLGDDGAPHKLTLNTLQETGMEEKTRKEWLSYFENKTLLSYETLPNGGYEITAHANDTSHTVIHSKNGKVWVGEEDPDLGGSETKGSETKK